MHRAFENDRSEVQGQKGDDVAISEAEWDLLAVLWEHRRLTAREAADALSDTRGWAYSTVKTMLDRMVAKNLVRARQVGNVWEYTPALEKEHARGSAWRRFVSAAFGGAMTPALEFIASEGTLTRKERAMLLKALQDQDTPKTRSGKGRKEQRP